MLPWRSPTDCAHPLKFPPIVTIYPICRVSDLGRIRFECAPRQFLGKSNYVLVSRKQRIVGTGKQGRERKNRAADPDRRRRHYKLSIAVKDIGESRSSGSPRQQRAAGAGRVWSSEF